MRLSAGCSANQRIDNELSDGVGTEDDNEANNASVDPLFGFANFFFVASGRHPKETTVKDDNEDDDADKRQGDVDDFTNRRSEFLRSQAGARDVIKSKVKLGVSGKRKDDRANCGADSGYFFECFHFITPPFICGYGFGREKRPNPYPLFGRRNRRENIGCKRVSAKDKNKTKD